MKRYIAFFFLLLFAIPVSLTHAQQTSIRAQADRQLAIPHQPGEFIVKYKTGFSVSSIEDRVEPAGITRVRNLRDTKRALYKADRNKEADAMVKLLSDPGVESVQPNYLFYTHFTPNDTNYTKQYGLNNTGQTIAGVAGTAGADIKTATAWDTTKGSTSVKVAVIDSGINLNHPDLSSKVADTKSFVSSTSVEDGLGHGTHVAGIIAASTNNTTGVAGVCPDCKIVVARVFNDLGSTTTTAISDAIRWSADSGAKVINLSLGQVLFAGEKNQATEDAINYALSKNVVVVASAGNCGDQQSAASQPACRGTVNPPTYPANYAGVLSVAATDNKDQKAGFSNYSNSTAGVRVAAPGLRIYSTVPTHSYTIKEQVEQNGGTMSLNYEYMDGTSMSGPMVAGVAGLVWSTSYGTNATAVKDRIEATADQIAGTGTKWVKGRVNAEAAVRGTSNPTGTPTVSPTGTSPSPTGTTCPTLPTDKGLVTMSITASETGTYTIWTRMKNGTAATDDSFWLQVDNECGMQIGGSSDTSQSAWSWTDYSPDDDKRAQVALTAGTHTLTLRGNEPGVKIDRLLLTTTSCVPTGLGANCEGTQPTVTVAPSPTNGPTPTGGQPTPTGGQNPTPTGSNCPPERPNCNPTATPRPSDQPNPSATPRPSDRPNPTSTPRPSDRPEPTRQPTIIDESCSLGDRCPIIDFIFTLHGVGIGGDILRPSGTYNTNPATKQRQVTIGFYNSRDVLVAEQSVAVAFSGGTFTGTLKVSDKVTPGNYIVRAKTAKYLRKRLGEFVQIENGRRYGAPQVQLIAGDMNNDNRLTIQDYEILRGCYSVDQQAKACDTSKKQLADLTDDGKVDQFDLNLFVREYSLGKGD